MYNDQCEQFSSYEENLVSSHGLCVAEHSSSPSLVVLMASGTTGIAASLVPEQLGYWPGLSPCSAQLSQCRCRVLAPGAHLGVEEGPGYQEPEPLASLPPS
jgi:hypothetical protein